MKSQRLEDYLEHILTAIERISDYLDEIDEVQFLGNTLVQDAVIRNLEIIGEASNKVKVVYPSIQEEYPHVPFSFAYQMRNVIAHGYFKVDYEIVWKTIHNDLPGFYEQIKTVLKDQQDKK
jgi:uncharacterized protein with HEPN domain